MNSFMGQPARELCELLALVVGAFIYERSIPFDGCEHPAEFSYRELSRSDAWRAQKLSLHHSKGRAAPSGVVWTTGACSDNWGHGEVAWARTAGRRNGRE